MCLHLVALTTIFILPKIIGGDKRSISLKTSSINNSKTDINLVNGDNSCKNNKFKKNDDTNISSNLPEIKNKSMNGDLINVFDNNKKNNNPNKILIDNNDDDKILRINNTKNDKINSDDLQNLINNKNETRNNIEGLFDKTVTGIVELKDDLMRMNENNDIFINADGLRKRTNNDITKQSDTVDNFLKKEIDALNAAVQQANVLPVVLSNGNAKYYN